MTSLAASFFPHNNKQSIGPMMKVATSILINAPLKMVWEHLINFQTYSAWNPYIVNIEGTCVREFH